MGKQHVTQLLTRYVNGTLRPQQRVQVVNHVRQCDACRAALAREERVARELQRDLAQVGTPQAGQLAAVWAGVMGELNTPHSTRRDPSALFSGLTVVIAVAFAVLLALPLMAESGIRAEAAPQQALPVNAASPTPGVTETGDAGDVVLPAGQASDPARMLPQATVAFVSSAGMTPAPVPQVIGSPEAVQGGGRW